MKLSIAFLLIVSGISVLFTRAQSQDALDAPGSYRSTHFKKTASISFADNTMASQMIDAIVDALQKQYPQPTGAEIGPYGGVLQNDAGPSEIPNGPYMLSLTIPFYDMSKDASGKIKAGGEYSSSLWIWINRIRNILEPGALVHGNDRLYRMPVTGSNGNGYPTYNEMVVLTMPGKTLPWRAATREEYLQNLIEAMQKEFRSSSGLYLKENISRAQQLLASMSPGERSQTAYLRKSKFPNSEFEYYKWAGFQSASDPNSDPLVILDDNYYDKTLPRNCVQLIAIESRAGTASMSAAAATPEEKMDLKRRQDRLNNILRNQGFLQDLQALMGRNGLNIIASTKKKMPALKYVVTEAHIKNIDHILDSMFRTYQPTVPTFTGSAQPASLKGTPLPELPARNGKMLALAARQLNTTAEVANYIDELERKLAPALEGAAPKIYDEPGKNNLASYGYWLLNKPKEALILALRAAKQQPENDVLLNNLGATLGICGIGYLGVPFHIVCIKKEPGNSTISNNLGQAYLEMGDQATAEVWLKKALMSSPNHPHANNSLGYMYQKMGRKQEAIRCYENSLRTSFTLSAYRELWNLKSESALKLMDLIRHRYKQPDYINFDKYITPQQCHNTGETEIRKAEHKVYQQILDKQIEKYEALRTEQQIVADKSVTDFLTHNPRGKPYIKSFQPFATAMLLSIRNEAEDKSKQLNEELIEIEKERTKLRMEYDTSMAKMKKSFEKRLNEEGEGHVDPALEEEICTAKKQVADLYLPLMAENNEKRFTAIVHANKQYLNDYLYWIKFACITKELYQSEYYEVLLTMFRLLKEVRLTTLEDFCDELPKEKSTGHENEEKEPDCPFGDDGIELPFVIGKVMFDCEGWGIDLGEGIKVGIEHRFGGETTVALGLGVIFAETPKIMGHEETNLNPGVEFNGKIQFFATFDGNQLMDGGMLWETEIDARGLGKPYELKQNFTWAIVKGFTGKGVLTDIIDKYYEVEPEKQVNKNVKIYNVPR